MTYIKSLRPQRRSGFTLIETVGVLVLLSIIAVGAVSFWPASNVSLVAEADRLSSHLRYAQIRAQADIYEWRLVFEDSTTTYKIGPMVVPGAGFTPGIVPGAGGTQRVLTDGITTTAGTIIHFDSWGRPVNAAGVLLPNQTITLTQGAQTRTITIQAGTGLIP